MNIDHLAGEKSPRKLGGSSASRAETYRGDIDNLQNRLAQVMLDIENMNLRTINARC